MASASAASEMSGASGIVPPYSRNTRSMIAVSSASYWVERGASDGHVNDFGGMRSIFFRDTDGPEGEVLITK